MQGTINAGIFKTVATLKSRCRPRRHAGGVNDREQSAAASRADAMSGSPLGTRPRNWIKPMGPLAVVDAEPRVGEDPQLCDGFKEVRVEHLRSIASIESFDIGVLIPIRTA